MQKFASGRIYSGSAPLPPGPTSRAVTKGAAARPPAPNIAMLMAIAGPTFVWACTYATYTRLWYGTAAESIVVVSGSLWLLERSRRIPVTVEVPSPIRRSVIAFIVALVVCTIIAAVAGDRSDANKFIPQTALLLTYTATFFGVAAASRRFDPQRAIMLACHGMALVGSMSILLDFVGLTSFESSESRYFGFLGDSAPWLLTLPLIVYFTTSRFYFAAMVGVPILLTASRGPALLIGSAMLLLFAFSKGRRLHYVVTLIPIAAVVLYQSDLAAQLLGRFSSTSLTDNDRVLTSLNGIKLFLVSPIWGSGYNALDYYFPSTSMSRKLGEFSVPTSSAIQMLSEGGILLFAAYLAFVLTATRTAIQTLRSSSEESGPIMFGLAAWLVAMLWVNQSAAWYLVGSYLAALVFGVTGILAGLDIRWREQRLLADYQRRAYLTSLRARPRVTVS